MKGLTDIQLPSASFITLPTRQCIELSPMQKIKIYRQKMMSTILFCKCLDLDVCITFLCVTNK